MLRSCFYALGLTALWGCAQEPPAKVTSAGKESTPKAQVAHRRPAATPISESDTGADTSGAGDLTAQLRPIRANFKWLNSISEWELVTRHELDSGEGGELTAYWYGRQPDKMLVRQYGETYQALTEYYLLKGELSFVLEKVQRYNRPLYYDAAQARQNNDDQAFDLHKSALEEIRSYFAQGRLIHQIHRPSVPLSDSLRLAEQQRLLADFGEMIRLSQQDYRKDAQR